MFSVYDGIVAYAREANAAFYISCVTSIFNDPNRQIYSIKGRETLVREYDAGNAGNYVKGVGWMQDIGNGEGIRWVPYRARYDRAKVMKVDALDEASSYENNMTPSLELLNSDFLNNKLPPEIDATNIATYYSQVPEENKHVISEANFGIEPDQILGTLNNLDQLVFNSGYADRTVLFISPEAYGNLNTAIQNKSGLASGMLIQKQMPVKLHPSLSELVPDAEDYLIVNVNYIEYGRFILIRVPDQRLFTRIILLSGRQDDIVQRAGGYVPDVDEANFGKIHLFAIPLSAAFTNIRYIVENYLYPGIGFNPTIRKADLEKMNARMYGNFQIGYAGINQKSNDFELDIRVMYGGSLFRNRARNCFVVTTELGAQTKVQSIDLTLENGETEIRVGQSIPLKAVVTPTNAYMQEVTYSINYGSGSASISDGVITGLTAGGVTVYAVATDGSNVSAQLKLTVIEN